MPSLKAFPANHNAAMAKTINKAIVMIICHKGIVENAALIGKLIGAVKGKILKKMEKTLFGFSIKTCRNQKGNTMGKVNKPANCCASRDSVVVAPNAAIMAATITNAGRKTRTISTKKEKSIWEL
jgi:hypothetical protein